ncbi:MAG: hypothetical protein PSX80_02650 [bacterium]|nr:hypothetical protein [bacterium]
MKPKFKLSEWLSRVRIGIAVGKVVAGGKAGGIFNRVEKGAEAAGKAREIAELLNSELSMLGLRKGSDSGRTFRIPGKD